MYGETVEAVCVTQRRRQRIQEKNLQKQKLAGAIFLEIVLRKFWESERENLKERQEKPGEQRRSQEEQQNHSREEGYGADAGSWELCSVEDGVLRERMVPTGDILELSLPGLRALISEAYSELVQAVVLTGKMVGNPLYGVSWRCMERIYSEETAQKETEALREEYRSCFRQQLEKLPENGSPGESLTLCYAYFTHANAYWAVRKNMEEGQRLVEACGMEWAGTSYYNSCYYFRWKRIQNIFLEETRRLFGPEEFDTTRIPDMFLVQGGITFHSMWQWLQRQNNDPEDQYGLWNPGLEPPETFVYLYRNHCRTAGEELRILLEQLEKLHSDKEQRRSQTEGIFVAERSYNNGTSYLVDFEPEIRHGEVSGKTYGRTMDFLKNFRLYRVTGCVECLFMAE